MAHAAREKFPLVPSVDVAACDCGTLVDIDDHQRKDPAILRRGIRSQPCISPATLSRNSVANGGNCWQDRRPLQLQYLSCPLPRHPLHFSQTELATRYIQIPSPDACFPASARREHLFLTVSITAGASYVTYHCIEKPGIDCGHKIARRLAVSSPRHRIRLAEVVS